MGRYLMLALNALALLAPLLLLLLGADAFACEDDRGCPANSRCAKHFGDLLGVCERVGDEPVRPRDRISTDPSGPGFQMGARCDDDRDCPSGMHCVALNGPTQKACVR